MENLNIKNLANRLNAYQNCIKSNNIDWIEKHKNAIDKILLNLPHGSGIDEGVKFDFDNSTATKLIFTLSFHHLNNNGYYTNWSEHKIIVTPTFNINGYTIKITGKNKNQIKKYLFISLNFISFFIWIYK